VPKSMCIYSATGFFGATSSGFDIGITGDEDDRVRLPDRRSLSCDLRDAEEDDDEDVVLSS
jgi:hypothetical protein